MMRALSTAATGMQAQEQQLSQIANDLANMNTVAFKKGRTEFQDLMYQHIKDSGGEPGQNQVPVGIQVGSGSRVAAQYSVHEQGPSKITSRSLDVMINGDGFLAVQLPTGQVAYTRDGQLKLDSQGRVVNTNGYPLVPGIQIPQGAQSINIQNNGEVRVMTAEGSEQAVGQIQLVAFLNPDGMRKISQNLQVETTGAGQPQQGVPGENGLGQIQAGALEASTVNPTESVMNMITAQRVYESNARIMNVSDQMWSTTNNIGSR